MSEYHIPATWDEAVQMLHHYGDAARPLAGGTVILNQMARGAITPQHLVSLDRLPDWNLLDFNFDTGLHFGSGVTYRQMERAIAHAPPYAALQEAAQKVGSTQIRNVATLAGNVCHASPAGDAIPPLLALDAEVVIYGPDGARHVPLEAFIVGPKMTILQRGELVQKFIIPALPNLPAHTTSAFLKTGRRHAMEISAVNVAVRLTLSPNDTTCTDARIALGAVAPTPIRAFEAEQLLIGQPLNPEIIRAAAELAVQATDPISDLRASADFRQHLTQAMTYRALATCLQRFGAPQ
jgi:carbon-monoxide dehydrogenase medium subunit